MTRYFAALALIFCVQASAQPPRDTMIQCSQDGWCRIHVDTLKLIVAQAGMNCGPVR